MTVSNFEAADALVLKTEGGYTNRAADPGGPTNLGITLATARAFNLDVDHDGDVDVIDVKLLKPADAAKVYKAHYWDTVNADQLPAGLDYAVFDFSVNSGSARAAKFLQTILGVTVDGQIGPLTLDAVRGRVTADLINQLCDARMQFLKRLDTWKDFGDGWTKRVDQVRATALAWDAAVKATAPVPLPPIQRPVDVPSVPADASPSTTSTPVNAQPVSLIDVLIGLILSILKGAFVHDAH